MCLNSALQEEVAFRRAPSHDVAFKSIDLKTKHPGLLLVWHRWNKICSMPQVSYVNTTSTPYHERKTK